MSDPQLAEAVQRATREAGLAGAVDRLERLSGGASRQTWSFDLVDGDERTGYILQRARPGAVSAGPGMEGEATLLRAAAAAGVPVPDVAASGPGDEEGGIGAPWVVTRRLDGETIPRKLLRDDEYAEARTGLAAACGRALAAIHRIDGDQVVGLDDADQLAQLRSLADGLGHPHPAFELGFRWLERERPAPVEPRVVHGDFRLGNLLVDQRGLAAVLDWELAHRGDPMEDLGWLCVRAWRFGEPAEVGGFGATDELFAAYEDAGGAPVDPTVVRWWQALGTLKWGLICILQTTSHLSGLSRSVELAAIGRRVCENEHDLLLLLPGPGAPSTASPTDEPGAKDTPAELTEADAPHDRPTAGELLDAVRAFLADDVLEATSGRTRFHTRVAVNVLGMVERQLALGPAQAEAHRARLAALGYASDAELAAAIRAGELDDRYDEVKAAVWSAVADKLAVANPTYAD